MKIGFTGTQSGMTWVQRNAIWRETTDPDVPTDAEFHHGMCEGADEQLHSSLIMGFWGRRIVGHPGVKETGAAWKRMKSTVGFDEIRVPKFFIKRNRDIVDETDELWAAPSGPEVLRSGTWATIRYARKKGKPIVIFWPDGSITEENT